MSIEGNSQPLSPISLDAMPSRWTEIWQHLMAARTALPEPLKQQGRYARLATFNHSLRYEDAHTALDTLECLADINDCSPEFHQHLAAAIKASEADPTFNDLIISPLADHPKNRHIVHRAALPLLSEKDREIIRECLRAAVEGPFFPEWEFVALIGLSRDQVAAVLSLWPDVDDMNNDVASAIGGTMGMLLGYPHRKEKEWPDFISVPPAEVQLVLERWRQAKGWG